MSISLIASNDINRLGSLISRHIHEQYGHMDPFVPVHIVTQTEGMNIWLKTKLAEHLGISANIRFYSPQQFIQSIYVKTGGAHKEYFSRESIQWVLFDELNKPEFLSNPSFKTITEYCSNDDKKRIGLAGELADLFDQYTIYRYDLIEKWNEPKNDCSDFQEYLWKQLKQKLNDQFNDKTEIRHHILNHLMNATEAEMKSSLQGMQHVYFFGLSIFTPYHMEIFKGLSLFQDLKFYFLNPSPSVYWYEDKPEKAIRWLDKMNVSHAKATGNSLLTNWGRIIQESFYLFLDCDEAINSYQDELVPIAKPHTLLGKLQQQIVDNAVEITDKFTIDEMHDGSLNIHSSYTKAREVESLYNFLVSLTEKDQTLTGKDIIVSCDIDEYAPYIQAIFDTAPFPFKYTIADSTYVQGDNPIQALKFFLLLTEENFNAEEVFQLLEYSSVKNKFGIQNTELIKAIIKHSLFRFGMKGNEEDDSFLFSLQHAIQKIIYGISIRTDGTIDDMYPLDILEGLDSMEGIRFCVYAEKLMELIEKRKSSKNIFEWAMYIEEVMSSLIFQDEENDENMLRYQDMLIKHVSKYECIADHVKEKISYQLFSSNFIALIGKDKREKRFVSHGITFCSYIPMRSLPFKVVCMLGMDFDKFPRKDSRLSFSHIDGSFRSATALIKSKRRRGDRNIRDNDKHLFLENIMSAKEYLFLSYIGNSAKDNAIIPPSILIDELIHYISENADAPEDIRKKIIVKHPLHTFSRKYNSNDSGLINYLIDDKSSNEKQITLTEEHVHTEKDIPAEEPIALGSLISFFKNPIKYYYTNILGIYFEQNDATLPVTEIFEMNDLDIWKIKDDYLNEDDAVDLRSKIMHGEIPPANMGKAHSELIFHQLSDLRNKIIKEKNHLEKKSAEIHLIIEPSIQISGRIENIYGNKLISHTLSKTESKRKDTIEQVIKFLCLKAAGIDVIPVFFNGEGDLIAYKNIDTKSAIDHLKILTSLFIEGNKRILPLFLNFDIRPTKIPDENNADLFRQFAKTKFKEIEDSIQKNFKGYALRDEYVLSLLKNKFFEKEENVVELFRNTSTVYSIIKSIYPAKMI